MSWETNLAYEKLKEAILKMYDRTQHKDAAVSIEYILNEQFKSWMKAPDLPDWYKLQKHAELEHKFYAKNRDKYPPEYIGLRFYQTFDRWVKMNFKYSLEESSHKGVNILY